MGSEITLQKADKRESFRVEGLGGEKTLKGEIAISGGKNSVLPAIAAAFVFDGPLPLLNVPDIEDVSRMVELYEKLGGIVTTEKNALTLDSRKIADGVLDKDIAKRLRASVICTGPLLARFGEVSFPHPGGCTIGPRPIDMFLSAYEKMGATVEEGDGMFVIRAPKGGALRGTEIFFPVVSVTATETLMLTALLAEGTTVLRNAAMEPEIEDLAQFLVSCGANIIGAGTPTITIQGGVLLHAASPYTIIPDRIELGSFLVLGALAANDLTLTNCRPDHAEMHISILKEVGVPISIGKDFVRVSGNGTIPNTSFRSFNIKTHEYPGFPTDVQAPTTVFLTQSNGEGLVFETIFENRLNYMQDLVRMGADIRVWDAHRATVKGPSALKGKELESPDIRAGLAFVIAAIIAKGESIIHNAYYIDRGYAAIEHRLQNIGVAIDRI
jgi:UDP-N-acetylglucosamine 1-carboxyvinyltransferase